MAVETVNALSELTSPASNDEIGIWDISAGEYKRITLANLTGGVVTGGGTIATGGFTLTVPATGTAALLATAQTFTAQKTFSVAPKVPAGMDAETFALDTSSGVTLTNNQSLPISNSGAFSGLFIAINSTTGTFGLYMCSGNTVVLISSSGGAWGITTAAQANNLFHSANKYWLENHSGATVFYYCMALRVRDAA